MKVFITSTIIIVITLAVILITSLLFNLQFIKTHITRQIVVYILQLVQLYIGFMLVVAVNKENKSL